jgi:hypothetical protein
MRFSLTVDRAQISASTYQGQKIRKYKRGVGYSGLSIRAIRKVDLRVTILAYQTDPH